MHKNTKYIIKKKSFIFIVHAVILNSLVKIQKRKKNVKFILFEKSVAINARCLLIMTSIMVIDDFVLV